MTATRMWGRTALIGGTKAVDNIPDANSEINDGDLCITITSDKVCYFHRFNDSSSDAEESPMVITPNDSVGNGRWELVMTNRDWNQLDLPSTDTLTEEHIFAYKFITNQGSSAEIVVTLPDLEYHINVVFIIEETYNMALDPPTGESFDLDGSTLTLNYNVDSDSTIGSKINATRMKDGSNNWIWSLDTVRGVWVSSGAT